MMRSPWALGSRHMGNEVTELRVDKARYPHYWWSMKNLIESNLNQKKLNLELNPNLDNYINIQLYTHIIIEITESHPISSNLT